MKIRNWIVGAFIVLAAIGLFASFRNPAGLFKQVLFMVLTAAVIYFIYRLWTSRKPGSSESRAFAKAAKQSKRRTKNRKAAVSNVSPINQTRKRPLRKKSAAHLTVIEGKKGKKKDRAIF